MPFRASKRLVWADLGPLDSVDMLVEVTFAGQTFRWSTRPVTMSDGDGAVLVFNGGLNALDFGTVLQTLADAPDQTSISLDVLWPVDVAELVAQGHDLSAATGELSAWVEGRAYEDRQVLVAGRVRQPNYGGFADPVSFTIEEAPFMDVGEWPATAQRADRNTWPTVQEGEIGRPYVQVIGQPGVYRDSIGAPVYTRGTRAMVVETGPGDNTLALTLLVAGHRVKSATVQVYYIGADGITPDEGYITTLGVPADLPVEYVQDRLGHWCSVVRRLDLIVVPGIRRSAEFQIRWADADGESDKGGLVWADEATAIRGAGDVMRYVLLQSTLRVDWARFATVRQEMNAWRIDGFTTEVVQPWEWISDNLLSLMPVSMHSGDGGIYPVLWRWSATVNDAIDRIEWGPGIVRRSNVEYERAPSEIVNRITLRYAWDLIDSEPKRAVIHTPRPDLSDMQQVTSEFAIRSSLRHGVTAESERTTNMVADDTTAHKAVNWRIVAEGFSHRSVEYEVPQRFAYLELGDVVTLTDSEVHIVEAVALVQGMTMTDTGRISITLQLVENVARGRKTTGPNPDDGAPDPGDY